MRFHLSYTFLLLLLLSGCGEEQRIEPQSNMLVYRPDRFPNYTIPDDNPVTKASVDLGRRLFYDPILSRDSSLSCGS